MGSGILQAIFGGTLLFAVPLHARAQDTNVPSRDDVGFFVPGQGAFEAGAKYLLARGNRRGGSGREASISIALPGVYVSSPRLMKSFLRRPGLRPTASKPATIAGAVRPRSFSHSSWPGRGQCRLWQ